MNNFKLANLCSSKSTGNGTRGWWFWRGHGGWRGRVPFGRIHTTFQFTFFDIFFVSLLRQNLFIWRPAFTPAWTWASDRRLVVLVVTSSVRNNLKHPLLHLSIRRPVWHPFPCHVVPSGFLESKVFFRPGKSGKHPVGFCYVPVFKNGINPAIEAPRLVEISNYFSLDLDEIKSSIYWIFQQRVGC